MWRRSGGCCGGFGRLSAGRGLGGRFGGRGGGGGLFSQLLQFLHRLFRCGSCRGLFLAGLANAGKALGHILDAVVDILFDIRQGRDGLLQGLLDLVERLHNVLLNILGGRAGVLAHLAQHLAQFARVFRQLVGPDEYKRHDDNDEQLGKSDLHVYTIPFRLLAGQSRLR